ncbi:hypothetical protein Ccrd_012654 [Cynara cardunculus var. scolymus]|uniref:Leucine-rich repeat, cysteine-containing subtype n=1 Tax=Cynara cardunculus var. scolymus TaxID=59895 RepID=A0A103YH27_CYNCS|nr:hypothetical protein Ccrd_012654 [Cynara cardunculus var. scolymus]
MIAVSDNYLVEVHLERLHVSDIGLSALSNCFNLEIFLTWKFYTYLRLQHAQNAGLIAVAEHCKYLRKLHINGWRINRIGNEVLIAIAKQRMNLQELVLIGVNPSSVSLEAIATNCQKLERLGLCGSETIADMEILCIASKCVTYDGLKRARLKSSLHPSLLTN